MEPSGDIHMCRTLAVWPEEARRKCSVHQHFTMEPSGDIHMCRTLAVWPVEARRNLKMFSSSTFYNGAIW